MSGHDSGVREPETALVTPHEPRQDGNRQTWCRRKLPVPEETDGHHDAGLGADRASDHRAAGAAGTRTRPRRGAGPRRLGRRVRLRRALLQARPDRVDGRARARWCSATRWAAPSSPSAMPWIRPASASASPWSRSDRAAGAGSARPGTSTSAATWSSSRPRRSTARSATTSRSRRTSPTRCRTRSPTRPSGCSSRCRWGIWANRKGGTTAGSRVFITGAGPIGAVAALAARAMGATDIIVSDPVASRRQRITELVGGPRRRPDRRFRPGASSRPTCSSSAPGRPPPCSTA